MMLPSTGLFKSIICPYFEDNSCDRPYCHFKHYRKDEEITNDTPLAQCSTTPMLLTLDNNFKTDSKSIKSTSHYSHNSQIFKYSNNKIPIYIPSPKCPPEYFPTTKTLDPKNSNENKTETSKEEHDLSDNKSEKIEEEINTNTNTVKEIESTNISFESQNKSLESPTKEDCSRSKRKKDDKSHDYKRKSKKHKSDHNSKSKSKSSTHEKERSNRNHKSSRHDRSLSKNSHKKDSNKNDSHKNNSSKEKFKEKLPDLIDNINSASSEEDINEQCKMIFEEYECNNSSKSSDIKEIKFEEETYDNTAMKKRLAHEKAKDRQSATSETSLKPNHIKNAMQSVFMRQQIVQKETFDAFKAKLDSVNVESKSNCDIKFKERISNSFLSTEPKISSSTGIKRIAPVANIIGLQQAKKKIEMIKAQAKITPCQTASKTLGRISHQNKIAANLPPPILEGNSSKISYNIRNQYYNLMVEHCLNIYSSCEDAWERAQNEELTVFKKCNTPTIYKSSALLAINKLKKESQEKVQNDEFKSKVNSKESKNSLLSFNKKIKESSDTNSSTGINRLPGEKIYELIYECRLTDEQLLTNGFPRAGKKLGTAFIQAAKSIRPLDPNERYCGRCSKLFKLKMYESSATDECNYHPKSTGYRRGFADNLHRCCQQPAGTPGCTYANYHVTEFMDYDNLTGFVTTIDPEQTYKFTQKDIYAIDCEMCYTTKGIELTRVTMVDFNSKTVYDTLVKPENKIIDYNTTYSGITEEMLKDVKTTLRDVQAILLSMVNSKTILIGHSLESDLKSLKIIHSVIVDTSVLFPHKMGPPKKRALKTLCIENLKRIIQENDKGHDSAEDAEVCIQLVKFYLRNKII